MRTSTCLISGYSPNPYYPDLLKYLHKLKETKFMHLLNAARPSICNSLGNLRLCLENHYKNTFEAKVIIPTPQNSCCDQFVFTCWICIGMSAQQFQLDFKHAFISYTWILLSTSYWLHVSAYLKLNPFAATLMYLVTWLW